MELILFSDDMICFMYIHIINKFLKELILSNILKLIPNRNKTLGL
jgi:hypothetical protein